MASGSQLNRWGNEGGVTLLSFPNAANVTAVTSPQYGTIGFNDSGIWATPIGLSKLGFQLLGDTTGLTVSVFGTLDPAAYAAYTAVGDPVGAALPPGSSNTVSVSTTDIIVTARPNGKYTISDIPSTSWILLEGPSSQSGTGQIGNPLQSNTTLWFFCVQPIVAVRVAVTAVSSPTGSGSVVGFAVP